MMPSRPVTRVPNFLATLLLSQGVPMLLGGDELGRTQGGNNNAYCQDNEISWYDWDHLDEDLFEFTRRLIALRRDHPVFRRRRWFQGRPIRGTVDLGWCRPDGVEMSDDDWETGYARSVGLFLNGEAITDRDRRGQRVSDQSDLLLFNADQEPIDWSLPKQWGDHWQVSVDTGDPARDGNTIEAGVPFPCRSLGRRGRPGGSAVVKPRPSTNLSSTAEAGVEAGEAMMRPGG